jgi:hypothetical protein
VEKQSSDFVAFVDHFGSRNATQIGKMAVVDAESRNKKNNSDSN